MQMEMLVHVDVVQRKTGSRECRKLGANLSLKLSAHGRQRKIADAPCEHAPVHVSGAIGNSGDQRRRKHRLAVGEHDVQPHSKVGERARPANRIGGGGRSHHQAGCGEDTLATRLFDGVIDRTVQSEIVGGDDQKLPLGAGGADGADWNRDQSRSTGRTEPSRFT